MKNRFKSLRHKTEMSQVELAKVIGLSNHRICKLEKGGKYNLKDLERYADLFGVSVANVMDFLTEKTEIQWKN